MSVLLLLSQETAAESKPASILVVGWFSQEQYAPKLRRLSAHLVRHGLRERVDYTFDYCQATTQEQLAAELASRRAPSLVLSVNTSPAQFVHRAGIAAPHVFQTYSDPVADGLVASYSRPGGSSTGVVEFAPVHDKRLDLLLALVPSARRIAVIVETSSGSRFLDAGMASFRRANPGVALVRMGISAGESAATIGDRLHKDSIAAAYVPLEGEIDRVLEPIFEGIRAARIPSMSEARRDIARGAVLALEVDRDDALERVAHQVALVLLGARPAAIPVQSPRKFLLTVNLDAARHVGVDVPRMLLRKAEFIVSHGK